VLVDVINTCFSFCS